MAKDKYHELVREALIKDGWKITDDPLRIQIEERTVKIDLGAEKLIAAEKDEQKIAVEIKSFIGHSVVTDFYLALGQFETYRTALLEFEPDRELYLAIPSNIYQGFFQEKLASQTAERANLKLLVYQINTQSIFTWKK